MVNKAKDKKTGEIVEYMVFVPEDFPAIGKWANIDEIETTGMEGFYNFAGHGFVYNNVPKFSYLVKRDNGDLAIFDVNHFQECFEKIEPDAFDKALEEHPEIQARIENAVKDYENEIRTERAFYLIPELESVLRFFEESQSIRLGETAEQEQARRENGIEALYNFCRGLVIGAKIARQ